MRKKNYKSTWEGIVNFSESYNFYINNLCSIAMSCFEWINLPKTVNKRYLEKQLIFNGSVVFFEDEIFGFAALKAALGGDINIYDVPTVREVISASGYNKTLYIDNSVIIYDNIMQYPAYYYINFFAETLAAIDCIYKINMQSQKNPYIILCDPNEKLSLENLFNKLESYCSVIYGKKNLDISAIKTLDISSKFLGKELFEQKQNVLKEAYSFLGVSVIDSEKSERMITTEVEHSLEASFAQRRSRLRSRLDACEEINNMFPGLNISCRYNTGVE